MEAYFDRETVGDLLPLADILRSDAHLVPPPGPTRAVSGYRGPAANLCFKGAKATRHLRFAARDLIPVRPIHEAVRKSLPAPWADGAKI